MDDHYQPIVPMPGAGLTGAVRAGWIRVFGAWRPDERTVGVLVVAWFVGGLIDRLLVADSFWTAFVNSVAPSDLLRPVSAQLAVQAVVRLLYIPAELLTVIGGVAIALRQGWGRAATIVGLAALLVNNLVGAITSLTETNAITARPEIGSLIASLGAALPLAVLLWSRRSPGEDA